MRVVKVLSALCVAILVMGGCDNWLRIPPTLRSPEDEAVFTEDTPTFAWGNQERIDSFHIVIWADSSLESLTLIDKLVTDTTYTIPSSIFEGLPRGKYFWKVANIMEGVELWSEVRFFQIDHDLPALDLDTTYYPLGLNYKWVYQNWVDGDIYNTNSVEVSSIEEVGNKTVFTLTITSQTGMSDFQYDLTSSAFILGNLMYYGSGRFYPLCASKDTLTVSDYDSGVSDTPWNYYYSGKRIKGLGLRSQKSEWEDYYNYQIYEDYLLYFIKGEDTVWTAD
jgi:hypothetical protein